jgi:hypothetical protein
MRSETSRRQIATAYETRYQLDACRLRDLQSSQVREQSSDEPSSGGIVRGRSQDRRRQLQRRFE